MDGACANRVVDMQLAINKLDSEDHYRTADEANDNRPGVRDDITTCSDAYKAGENAVESERERGLAILKPADYNGNEAARARREVGSEEDVRDGILIIRRGGCELRAGVETKPSEPEDENAQRRNGKAVAGDSLGRAVLVVLADAWSDNGRANESDPTANGMDDSGAN